MYNAISCLRSWTKLCPLYGFRQCFYFNATCDDEMTTFIPFSTFRYMIILNYKHPCLLLIIITAYACTYICYVYDIGKENLNPINIKFSD